MEAVPASALSVRMLQGSAMLSISLCLLCASIATPTPESAPEVVATKYKVYRTWDFTLPKERWLPVGDGLPFAGLGDTAFKAALDGTSLLLDSDGDGETDLSIALEDTKDGKTPLVVLHAGDSGGRRAVRLSDRGGWHYAPAGAVVAKWRDTQFKVIDQNGDGRFDGIGEDALVVGRGESASYLSEVTNVAGELFRLEVAEDGSQLSFTPFEGESGVLDMHGGYKTEAKLERVVVRDTGGRYSFDLGKATAGLRVPAGEYRLEDAVVVLGRGSVDIKRGKLGRIDVAADAIVQLDWGGPLEASFDYVRRDGELRFSPLAVWYHGQAGELYSGWNPRGTSPKFVVKSKETGEVLVDAVFPGSS